MKKNISKNFNLNKNGEVIVESVQIDKETDIYNGHNSNYENIFYYEIDNAFEIDKESGISFNKDYGGTAKIILKSENPLNYKKFHEEYIPLDMAFNALGIDDWQKNVKELLNDKNIYKEVEKRMNMITPISEEKFLELNTTK